MTTSPFFNEFIYIYAQGHPPLDLVNVAGLPVVKSSDEIPCGSILISVNRSEILPDGYDEAIKRVQSTSRPAKLTFRQLHAACGVKGMVDECRRFWQGFLRIRTGPGQWTCRFYVLQENSLLACYPVKDVGACTVIETVDVTQATLIYGTRLQQFCAADVCAANCFVVEDSHECCFALLTLGMEKLIFRAEGASAVMDWVSAFAVLFVSNELDLTSTAARANSYSSDDTAIASALSDVSGVTIPGSLAMPMTSIEGSICDTQIEVEEKYESPLLLNNSCILQGYLWKECGDSGDTWERRWFILSQDCKLTWFMAMPSGATEVPSGQLYLGNIVLVGNSSDKPDDKGGARLPGPSFLLVVRSGKRELHLRSLNRLQILSWQHALEAAGGLLGQPGPNSLRRDTSIMDFLQNTRVQMLQEFQNNPEQVLLDPETAFSLIVGHEVGGCTKDAFRPIAGRFMLPLCDQFTADFVWDELARVSTSTQPSTLTSLKPKAFKLLNLFHNKTRKGPPELATRNVTAEPLFGEERVDFETFKLYISALSTSTKPSEAWISLKLKLGLHPLEVLVAQEHAMLLPQLDAGMKAPVLTLISRSATSYGTGIGSGYLFLTDRHLLFRVTLSQVVKVVPLDSLESVSKSELSNLGSAIKSLITPDGALDVKGVVHTINVEKNHGGSGGGIEGGTGTSLPNKVGDHASTSKKYPIETMSLVVGNQWHLGKFSAVDTWLEYINELRGANQLDTTVPGWRLRTIRGGEKRERTKKDRRASSFWSLKQKVILLSEEATAGVDKLYVARSRLQLWTAANIIRCRALSSVSGTHVTCVMMVSRTKEILDSDEEAKGVADPQPRRHNQHLDALQSFLSDSNDISRKDTLSSTSEYGGGNTPPPVTYTEYNAINPKWLYILSSFLSHAREMKLRKETEAKSFSPTRFKEEWELFWDHMDPLMEKIDDVFFSLIEWRNPIVSLGVMGTLVSIGIYDLVNILIPLMPTIIAFYLIYAGSVLNYNKRSVENGKEALNRAPAKQHKNTILNSSQLRCEAPSETVSSPAHSEMVGNAEAVAPVMEGSSLKSEKETQDHVTSASRSTSPTLPPNESILSSIWRVQAQVGNIQSKLHSYNTILLKLHSLLVWADHERTKGFIVTCICMSLVMLLVPGKYIWISLVLFIFAYPIWAGTNSLPTLLIEDWWRGLPLESATRVNIEMARVQALHSKHD